MIRHVVMWKLREGAHGLGRKACAFEIKRRLEAMKGKIPGLLFIEAGVDDTSSESAWDVVLLSDFTDMAALSAYQAHPVHEAVKDFILEAAALRAVVDYEV